MQQTGENAYKNNKTNTFNKRQKHDLSWTPDRSLSIETPNMSIIDSPVEILTPVSSEMSLLKIIWDTLTQSTKKKETVVKLSSDKTRGLGTKFRK